MISLLLLYLLLLHNTHSAIIPDGLPRPDSPPSSAISASASAITANEAPGGTAANVTSTSVGNIGGHLSCAQSMVSVDHLADDGSDIDTATQMPFVTCEDDSKYCFALWHEEVVNGSERIVIMGQGCWETSDKSDACKRSECVNERKPTGKPKDNKFCCCSGDMCNANLTDHYGPNYIDNSTSKTSDGSITPPSNSSVIPCAVITDKHMPYILFYGCAAAIPICLMIVVCTCWLHKQQHKSDIEMGGGVACGGGPDAAGNATAAGVLLPADRSLLEKLRLTDTVIGEGRYGRVLRAYLTSPSSSPTSTAAPAQSRAVAAKVFPADHRNYYLNEYELYRVAGEHPHLVRCFGRRDRAVVELTAALEAANPSQYRYMLVLSLERESLQEYLGRETVDLTLLCRMTLGIAKGLAHLHCDLGKQCIAHRDLNTKNILVTADFNCKICDLGLAVVPRRTENKVLSEAGTLRYMAPEVLEGAVNLRDCESALRQIDVYALGLVLWEVGARCTDLQDGPPAPYAPPFHRELAGGTPTLEQMQTMVTKDKARPLWPATWRDGAAAARLYRETTEDSWDQDAEARLTSLCVEERLLELPTLRGRNITTAVGFHHPNGTLGHLLATSPTTQLINNNHLHDQHQHQHQRMSASVSVSGGNNNLSGGGMEASVGTVDTLLSPSGEEAVNNCKNSNVRVANGGAAVQQFYVNRLTAPPPTTPDTYLQPHQGRNPCMERNLLLHHHSESSDSPLIDKSTKHLTSNNNNNNNANTESQNLLTNDYLNAMNHHQRQQQQHQPRGGAMPIPYLQNAVHGPPGVERSGGGGGRRSMAANAKTNKFISLKGLKKLFHTKKNQGSLSLLKDTQVRMVSNKLVNNASNYGQSGVMTSLLRHEAEPSAAPRRPTTLTLPPSAMSDSKPTSAGVSQLLRAAQESNSDKRSNVGSNLSRQRSLEQFSEVFTSVTDLSRLKDPSVRVKTPGDVPASVRRTRGKAAKQSVTRFSLYDDRMMTQWGSAPDLDPAVASANGTESNAENVRRENLMIGALKVTGGGQTRDSVTSF